VYASDPSVAELAKDERPWALIGLITTMLSFTLYLLYQWKISGTDEVKNDKIAEITVKNINSGKISLLGALGPEFEQALREHHALRQNSVGGGGGGVGGGGGGAGIGLSLSGSQAAAPLTEDYGAIGDQDEQSESHPLKAAMMERLKLICRPFFHRYDRDLTGTLDKSEVSNLFADLGEAPEPEELKLLWEKFDKDKDGHLDFNEFLELVIDHSLKVLHDGHRHERRGSYRAQSREEGGEEGGGGGGGEEGGGRGGRGDSGGLEGSTLGDAAETVENEEFLYDGGGDDFDFDFFGPVDWGAFGGGGTDGDSCVLYFVYFVAVGE